MANVDDDRSLLGRWITAANTTAFETLVQRHIDFVFRAAVRQLDPVDRHMADDVTQAVFLVLYRKPRAAMAARTLPGWLHETTYYAVANARRIAARRRQHEADAAALRSEVVHVPQDPSDEADPPLMSKLDDAIARLGATDHALVIGRYLQGADIEVVAAQLRLTPDAARKRVERAIVKLRRYLASSGIAGVGVPDILDAFAHVSSVSQPPVAATLLTAAATGDGTSGGATKIATWITIRMLRTKLGFAAAMLVLAAFLTITSVGVTGRALAGSPTAATASAPEAAAGPTTGVPLDSNRERVVARFKRLANLGAEYTSTTIYTPPESTPLQDAAMRGAYGNRGYFSFLRGNAIYDRTLDEATAARETAKGATGELLRDLRVYNGEGAQSLSLQAGDSTHRGTISNTRWMPHDLTVDIGLGLRMFPSEQWLSTDQVEHLKLEEAAEGRIVGTHVTPEGPVHRWEWDPTKDHVLTSYAVQVNGRTRYEVVASDLTQVNGLMLPKRLVQKSFYETTTGLSVSRSTVVQVDRYVVDDPGNKLERYRIQWPKGTVVLDERNGVP